ncbi:MAG TPA: C40 family peptidase [Cellulomonas sp.]
MSVRTSHGRHRAASRPSTPITQFTSTATAQLQIVGRRTVVVAASSGLVVSAIGAAPAYAGSDSAVGLPSVDTAALAAQAQAQLDLAPVVTAPSTAAWTVDVPDVTPVKPAPPAPVAKKAAAAKVSRSAERAVADAPPPLSVAGSAVLQIAARYVGTPYRSGGSTPAGFDCSGFVQYVYAQLGIALPRSSSAYRNIGTRVSAADALPGDIMYTPGHVAIYAGDGMEIDSPRPGKTIQFRAIWQSSPIYIRVS